MGDARDMNAGAEGRGPLLHSPSFPNDPASLLYLSPSGPKSPAGAQGTGEVLCLWVSGCAASRQDESLPAQTNQHHRSPVLPATLGLGGLLRTLIFIQGHIHSHNGKADGEV